MQEKVTKNLGGLALKTLVFLLVLTILLTTIFLVALPRTSSNILTKLGVDGLASNYAKVAYERTKDFNDLALTFNKSVLAENYKQVKKYGQILVADANFDDYVKFQNTNQKNYDYKKWALGNIAVANLHIDGISSAIENLNLSSSTQYVAGHQMSYLTDEVVSKKMKLDKDEIALVNDKFNMIFKGQQSRKEDCKPCIIDAYSFAKAFCDNDVAKMWFERYEKVN
ncbi:MAG: hypothetical protein RR458_00885 [Clostridia bacterium]